MAANLDDLIKFLLSEIALCGVQGAGSADFHRFLEKYYQEAQHGQNAQADERTVFLPPGGLGRKFQECVWQWVCDDPDTRITRGNDVCTYSLSEFEAVESRQAQPAGLSQSSHNAPDEITQSPKALSAFGHALRETLTKERLERQIDIISQHQAIASIAKRDTPYNSSKSVQRATPTFEIPESTITVPRLFASQSSIWHALTGHGIDLKRVPSMEFVLLSLIAARGSSGITQPDLTKISGQDKRSVPNRTNELARKGYIVKNPVQSGKIRTSLCVHKKFVSEDHFLSSSAVEDVFQVGTFVLSGFVQLLYQKLKDAGIVPTREMRKKLGVPMRTWNKRATQGALIRLDQTGMIKRFRVRKKHATDSWVTCVQILRAPREEDVNNLGFRRQVNALDDNADELLDEDIDGDTLMRDLEVDMLNDTDSQIDGRSDAPQDVNDIDRIPPQWTPGRFFANLVFEVVALGGVSGWDSGTIRDRVVGPFWRRPMESYLTRLTDDWEKTQPLPLRHLGIIRDSRNTEEKKFLHYVYRTYDNFQMAVEAGEVHWEGVRKPESAEDITQKEGKPKEATKDQTNFDIWSFETLDSDEFIGVNGSATLSQVRSAIVHPRKYGSRWDNALNLEIGYKKGHSPITKLKKIRKGSKSAKRNRDNGDSLGSSVLKISSSKKKVPFLSLTLEQRTALGLKSYGRLSKDVEQQIVAHRAKSGDPNSLPEAIEETPSKAGRLPLMTAEERIAHGLPPKGRLGIARENKIRAERGLAKIVKKSAKRANKTVNEPALLTREQRLAFGWKGHGRLPQELMDGLREERRKDIPLEESIVVTKFMDILKAKAAAPTGSTLVNEEEIPARPAGESEKDNFYENQETDDAEEQRILTPSNLRKRKDRQPSDASSTSKKRRVSIPLHDQSNVSKTPPPSTFLNDDINASTSRVILDARSPEVVGESSHETPVGTDVTENPQRIPRFLPTHASRSITVYGAGSYPNEPIAKDTLAYTTSSPLLHLSTSTLNAQDQAIYDLYTNRTIPGLYINPFARHRGGRGRPRKAFIATFRFSSEKRPGWLEADATSQENAIPDFIGEATQTNVVGPEQRTDEMRDILSARTPSALPQLPQPTTQTIANESSVGLPNKVIETQPLPILHETNSTKPVDFISLQIPDGPQSIPQDSEPVSQIVPEGLANHLSEQITVDSIATTTLDETNTTQQVAASPYGGTNLDGTNLASNIALLSTNTRPATGSDSSNVPAGPPQTPISSAHDVALLEAGGYSAISEIPSPLPPKQKPRSKKEFSSEGSSLLFRRKIIREIIDLCNGTFPDGGEIGRPFHTLWSQRHGHMTGIKEPIASTVNATLRNMCIDPKFGLKRMSFLVKNKNGPFTSRKWMITYAHLTTKSPEVMRLAHLMANFSLEKSHQYFPEQIRHLVDDSSLYCPVPVPPKDESIILNQLNRERDTEKKKAQRKRINEMVRQKKLEEKARKAEKAPAEAKARKANTVRQIATRTLRPRLASLNARNTRHIRGPAQQATLDPLDEEFEGHVTGTNSSAKANPSKGVRLIWLRPLTAPAADENTADEILGGALDNTPSRAMTRQTGRKARETPLMRELTKSAVTETSPPTKAIETAGRRVSKPVNETTNGLSQALANLTGVIPLTCVIPKPKKRLLGVAPADKPPLKKTRFSSVPRDSHSDDEYIQPLDIESESSSYSSGSASEDEVESEEDLQNYPVKDKSRRQYSSGKRKRGKLGPLPTILERLTGLTGDPNDPIYVPPQPKQQHKKPPPPRPRSERRLPTLQSDRERKSVHILDPVDKFKRVCFSLVVAASMSGEDGLVDWHIVEKGNEDDKFFEISRAKKLWMWMQTNMEEQLAELLAAFQSSFLVAYESGRVAAIEDSENYDWASLVWWTLRNCEYPELPLPLYREALAQFIIDESSYVTLDRARWYKEKMADRVRAQAQLYSTFSDPLHRSRYSEYSRNDTILKARSWVRSNTATPQAIYSGIQAHDKLKVLGDSIFARVVGDYVEKRNLRMRKLKRLLPGRNYTFTNAFARKFARPFELSDFMNAVQTKKRMDSAFANEDPQKRFYTISQYEENGPLMVIMNLLSDGKVKLMPQLPPVDNEFGAPLPRLSVWGLCEGDYNHRAIDPQRLSWDIYVVPTGNYQFGNPLQPQHCPLVAIGSDQRVEWSTLPDPPLPGKNDNDALLPIWSSINGQSITWPWWYRILNIVLQPLIFQPGATATDIFIHCAEHTAEVFEIDLILRWLESVNAVSKITGGGYTALPGFWAAFSDKLLESENDSFGEHVKRKSKRHELQQWRKDYNMQHSSLQTRNVQHVDGPPTSNGNTETQGRSVVELNMSKRILRNPRQQYRISHQSLNAQRVSKQKEKVALPNGPTSPEHRVTEEVPSPSLSPTPQGPVNASINNFREVVDMADVNDGINDDIDAEGEVDEVMLDF